MAHNHRIQRIDASTGLDFEQREGSIGFKREVLLTLGETVPLGFDGRDSCATGPSLSTAAI